MLIRGDKLSDPVRREVLAAYGYRWTIENLSRARQWLGRSRLPRIDPIPDAQWLAEHAFHVTKDGSRLMRNRRHAEPACLAD